MDRQALGSRVRRLRVAAGLSQAELAGEDLSASYVSLIETGRREPTAAAIETLASRLGTTRAHLLRGAEVRSATEIRLQLAEAEMALRNGDPHVSLDLCLALLDGLEPVADRVLWRGAVFGVARAHERLGDLRAAAVQLELLRQDSGPGDAEPTWVAVLVALVRCYREAGDRNLAERIGEDALTVFDALGNPGGPEEITLANTLIGTYFETGDRLRASTLAEATLARAEASGDLDARATSYWSASQVAHASGQTGLALDYAQRAMALFGEADKRRNADMVAVHRAWLLLQDSRNAGKALRLLSPVLRRLEKSGDDLPLAYCRLEVAKANLHLGEPEEARVLADLAAETFTASGNLDGGVSALTVLAQAAQVAGDTDAAVAALTAAARHLEASPGGRMQAELWAGVAATYAGLGDLAAAVAAYARSAACAGIVTLPVPTARTDARA